ncbi:MAG TPA: hypothetical protein VHG93_12060 [Longimicrobium sp.]|nr:hypothetical protein [Longimicrobium sp.]
MAIYEHYSKELVELWETYLKRVTNWEVRSFAGLGHLEDLLPKWQPHIILMHWHGQVNDPHGAPIELASKLRNDRGGRELGKGPLLVALHHNDSTAQARAAALGTFDVVMEHGLMHPSDLVAALTVALWNLLPPSATPTLPPIPLSSRYLALAVTGERDEEFAAYWGGSGPDIYVRTSKHLRPYTESEF